MCLNSIRKRYDPPLKEVIAYGLFRRDKPVTRITSGIAPKEGIYAEYGHPYKGPYLFGKRYKAKDVPGYRQQIGGGWKNLPKYKVGFHKYKKIPYIPLNNEFVAIKVKLENVRLMGTTESDMDGMLDLRMIYVADYMTLIEEVKRDG